MTEQKRPRKSPRNSRSERPEMFAGVPEELARWARDESPGAGRSPRRRSGTSAAASRPLRAAVRGAGTAVRGARSAIGDTLGRDAGGLAAAAAVGIGAALIEAELLPGILLGAGAMLLGHVFPGLGARARPLVKSGVGAGLAVYDKTRAALTRAGAQAEQVVAGGRRAGPAARPKSATTSRRTRQAAKKTAQAGASAAVSAAPEVAAEAA